MDLAGRSKIRWIMKPPFADSWVTFDRDGTLTELKKTDAALASAGREPVTEEEAKAIRRSLTERIRDIERFGNDRATTAILSHEAARKAVEAYYSRHRRWLVGAKRLVGDLQAFAPGIHALFLECLMPGPQQAGRTVVLVDAVLREFGGRWTFPERTGTANEGGDQRCPSTSSRTTAHG